MNSAPSALTDLNHAIKSENPFDRPLVVRSHDVWEQSFPDVPSINAHASNAVFQAIEKIRAEQCSVIGITIKAERGLGKSHLISRIRRRLQIEGGSFFVYMSEYGDLNRINSKFLDTLASSLKQIGNQGVMQWQELATALVNEAIKKEYTPQQLSSRFPGALAQNPRLVDNLTAKVLQLKSNIENPYLIQAILWTLSPDKVAFAINWLSGRDLAQSQADAMGLPNQNEEDKEAEALQTVCQILDLIGDYRTLVICFDELESIDCNERGFTRAQVAALLAKDLYGKIKRGILMMAMYPLTWTNQVRAVPEAQAVTDRIANKTFDLNHLNADGVVAIVSHWVKDFYDKKGLTPPNPFYPFNEGDLRELGKEKPMVRAVLKWCAENWKESNGDNATLPKDPLHRVAIAFEKELAALDKKIDDYLEDNATLAEALRLGFLAVIGETIERVQVERIEDVQAKSADKGYLHFRIVGKEDGKVVKLGVAVIQNSSGRFVSAALKRLIDYQKFDITRGCLLRTKTVNPNTKGQDYLDQLLSKKGGEWVMLRSEDIRPLLAIRCINNAREDYEVKEDEIRAFVVCENIAANNNLIREILSNPSGQLPDDLTDEDSVSTNISLSEKETVNNTTNSTPDTSEIVNFEVAIDDLLKKLSL
jgi:hypothetical protein